MDYILALKASTSSRKARVVGTTASAAGHEVRSLWRVVCVGSSGKNNCEKPEEEEPKVLGATGTTRAWNQPPTREAEPGRRFVWQHCQPGGFQRRLPLLMNSRRSWQVISGMSSLRLTLTAATWASPSPRPSGAVTGTTARGWRASRHYRGQNSDQKLGFILTQLSRAPFTNRSFW